MIRIHITFDIAVDRLLGHEGNYVNNPNDPGGETKFGISKRSYPKLDIRNLTREDAIAIYKRDFWDPISLSVPDSVKYQMFDFAVNSGIDNAIRALQRAIGVSDDGHWGPISNGTAESIPESDMLMLMIAERLDWMTYRSNWQDASKGWTRRMAKNLKYAAADNEV